MSFAAVAVGVGSAVAGAAATSAFSGGGNSGGGGAQGAAAAADPFASQRGQYQSQLAALMSNPSSVTTTPGYQFNLQQGLLGVEGSAAANGMLNSGNVLTSLQQYGSNYASTQLNNQELLLAQLAGANVGSPGTAGQILQGQNNTNQQSASALGSAVSGAVTQGYNNYSSSGYVNNPFATDTSGYGAGSNSYNFNSGVSDPSYGVSYGFGA